MSIHDRLAPGPLWLLILTSPLAFLVPAIVIPGAVWVGLAAAQHVTDWMGLIPSQLSSNALDFSAAMVSACLRSGLLIVYWLMIVGVTIAAMGFLCGLRQTLGRCRVRSAQILRVVAYAAGPVQFLWAVAITGLMAAQSWSGFWVSSWVPALIGTAAALAGPAAWAILVAVGLKTYLRLPRAVVLAISAILVSSLAAVTAVIVVEVSLMKGWT